MGLEKRMIDIWDEFAKYKTTSKRFAVKVWIIIKQGWLSDLKISEILQQINKETCQLDPNIENETLDKENRETSDQIGIQSNSNRNTTHPNNGTKINTRKKRKVEFFQKIMSEK